MGPQSTVTVTADQEMPLLRLTTRESNLTRINSNFDSIQNDRNKVLYSMCPNKLDFHCILLQKEIQEVAQKPAALRKGIQNRNLAVCDWRSCNLFPVLLKDFWIKKTSPPWNFASIYKKRNPKSVENEKS